jgi:uncharacterized membrane protein
MHLLASVLCLAAFAALAAATERQQQVLASRPLPRATSRGLQIGGTILLLVALAALVAGHGWGLGLVMYSGHTSVAAGCVYCALVLLAQRGR